MKCDITIGAHARNGARSPIVRNQNGIVLKGTQKSNGACCSNCDNACHAHNELAAARDRAGAANFIKDFVKRK